MTAANVIERLVAVRALLMAVKDFNQRMCSVVRFCFLAMQ